MRSFLIDTNVLVAALLTRRESSPTVRWLRVLLEGSEAVVVSSELLAEYRTVLLRKVSGMDTGDVDAILAAILSHARVLDPPPSTHAAPDPGDAHLWALLEADPDTYLVTGDIALIQERRDDRALNPKDALDRWLTSDES